MAIKSIVAGLFLAAASLGIAHATTVDFRTLPSGTVVTNQYGDFTASLSGGNASGDPTIAYYGAGLSNSPTAGTYPTAQFLNIKFISAVDALSFIFNDEDYNGGNEWTTYDANNNVLESGILDDAGTITVSATQFGNNGISMISFDNGFVTGQSNWTQALSVLNYNLAPQGAVPEPASFLLLGAGIVGFAASRRRRKSI